MMQRRLFLQALAASVVAVGAPLPVGFPDGANSVTGTVSFGQDALVDCWVITAIDRGTLTVVAEGKAHQTHETQMISYGHGFAVGDILTVR